MRRISWLLGIWIGAIGGLDAQCTHALWGKIMDEQTRQPLPYASVWIKETQQGVEADSLGNYKLKTLCPGDYTLEIAHLDCANKAFLVHIPQGNPYHFYLPHSLHQTEAVIIKGTQINAAPTQPNKQIAGMALEQMAGLSLGAMLEKVSGLSSFQTGATIVKPVIHGLHSNRILILNNGIRQEGQQWGSEHAPEIDAMLAKKLTVIKGADAVRYGADAMGGVILVEPDNLPDSTGWKGELHTGVQSNGRGGYLSGSVSQRLRGKWSPLAWRVQATAKGVGSLASPRYVLANTALRELNGSAAAIWQGDNYHVEAFYSRFHTRVGIYRGAHIGNLTDLQEVIAGIKPPLTAPFTYAIDRPYQNISHDLFLLKYYRKVEGKGRLNLTYALQNNNRSEYDLLRFQSSSKAAALRYNVSSHSLEGVWAHKNWGKVSGNWGAMTMFQTNWVWGTRYLMPSYRTYNAGVFAIERWRGQKWELEAGARYDLRYLHILPRNGTETWHDFGSLSANAGLLYKWGHDLQLRLHSGRAWRAPSVNELYSNGLHHGVAAIEIGNPTLKAETGIKTLASLDLNRARWNANLTLYHHLIQNYVYLKPDKTYALTVQGAFPVFRYTQADVRLSGLDFDATYQFDPHISLAAQGSLLEGWNRSAQEWLIYMPPNRLSATLKWQTPHLKKWQNPALSLTHRYVFAQNKVPENQDFAPPPPAYMLWDIQAQIQGPRKRLSLFLSVQNLLNTPYRDYMDRFRYFSDAMGRNVSLKLSWAW